LSRAEQRRPIVYGRNPVREALRGRRRVHRVWCADPQEAESLAALAGGSPPPIERAGREELERLSGSPDHQGLACEVDPYRYADPDALLEPSEALVVALDQIQDPQNLGAICRSAECAGAAGVVIPERGSAAVTPAVCRASAGAVEHLPVARVRNLADFLAAAKKAGAWIYGAAADANTRYDAVDYGARALLVLGGEGKGLRPRVKATCDQLVALPLRGRVSSLNVSAAAAVLIYEALRSRSD
jgi:23S rRNA (guanosine2251-2'-O)-methyltransferase